MSRQVWGGQGVAALLLTMIITGAAAQESLETPPEAAAEIQALGDVQPVPDAPSPTPDDAEDADTAMIEVEPLRDDTPPEEALAAPEDSARLDTIEVTGSRIRRADFETAQPVTIVSREDIERTGLTNIGDLLQELPSAGSALNRQFNNGGSGTTEIDLRNLGSQRVLVLVDGHRWVAGTSFANLAAVDLNTIPVSVIERIEILRDGASAIYGSDAITGVVNIITKKDYDGVEVRAQAGAFDDGKGLQQAYNFTVGTSNAQTSMFFDISFVRQDDLFAGDRAISREPKFGTGLTRGSLFTPRGTLLFVPTPANGAILGTELCPSLTADVANGVIGDLIPGAPPLPDPQLGGVQLCQMILRPDLDYPAIIGDASETTATVRGLYEPYNNTSLDPAVNDAYNFAPINYLLTPFEQTTLFGKASHAFTDGLRFNLLLLYNNSKTERQLAETPLLFGDLLFPPYNSIYIAADQRFNPFDQDIGRTGEDGLIGTGILARRLVELGPRFLGRDKKTIFARASVDGLVDILNTSVNWDAGYSLGRSDNTNVHRGDVNIERLARAIGPDADCVAPCVPLNLFGGPGSITPEMANYISYTASSYEQAQTEDLYANAATFFSVPGLAAPLGVAAGVEYRSDQFTEQPDPFVEAGISSTNIRRRTEGRYYASEAYLEFDLPILAGLPYAEELGLSLAGRYTRYNTFDPATTGKVSLRYKPIASLMLRGTVSQAFRAPSLTDLYLGEADSYPALDDPCVDPLPGSNAEANCAEDGVTDADQLSSQILTKFSGNRDLDPETADTITAGIVWSPDFAPDLGVTVDYFNIKLDDFITNLGPDFILDVCYNAERTSGRPEVCDFVVRNNNGTGSIQFIRAATFNFSRLETSGVDFNLEYRLPIERLVEGLGTFKLTFDSQYLINYDSFLPTVDGSEQKFPGAGQNFGDTPLPRVKANLGIAWTRDVWSASWIVRYIRSTTEFCNDGIEPSLRDIGVCSDPDPDLSDGNDDSTNELGDVFYHNVQVGLEIPDWQTQLLVGVINLFDQQPPVSYTAFANSYPGTLYEAPGLQPYLRLSTRF
ncbi:TonB-dependent receptor plug domain-containing protein [Sinimarinibacterium thermocellulolyticum]|uniref:TonB-dependent receptor n=1 Tax=Sinimarinibacterium thermocellulolyticum TaxID=3170016 RepID=A0ABV2ABI9_9GAMM